MQQVLDLLRRFVLPIHQNQDFHKMDQKYAFQPIKVLKDKICILNKIYEKYHADYFFTWGVNLFVGRDGRQAEPIPNSLNLGILENIACVWSIRQNKTSIAIKNFIFEILFLDCWKTEIDTCSDKFSPFIF